MDSLLSDLTSQELTLWRRAATLLKEGRSWDLVHTKTCLGYAIEIADGEQWSPELKRIILPAVMLHDIGWALVSGEMRGGQNHGQKASRVEHMCLGAEKAKELLAGAGYSGEEIATISTMIGEHDNPYIGKPFECPYTHYLREIDILWRLNPISFTKGVTLHMISPEQLMEQIHEQFQRENVLSASGRRVAARLESALTPIIAVIEEQLLEKSEVSA